MDLFYCPRYFFIRKIVMLLLKKIITKAKKTFLCGPLKTKMK